MIPWANETHYRLYLQGHNGRKRQQIIDYCAPLMMDPILIGQFSASVNMAKLDNVKIVLPPAPWYIEVRDTLVHWARLAWSIIEYGW